MQSARDKPSGLQKEKIMNDGKNDYRIYLVLIAASVIIGVIFLIVLFNIYLEVVKQLGTF